MNAEEVLRPYLSRSLRTVLALPEKAHGTAQDALFALIYGRIVVDHSTAVAVEREVERSDKRVEDVVNGWRPESLAGKSS